MPAKHARCKHVLISDEELQSGITSLESVQAGVEEFHKNGIVIFENAIPHDIIDKFYEKMNTDGAQKLEDPDLAFNHGNEKTSFSLSPPLSKEWLIEDIWANKHAAAVMEAIIGTPQLVHAGSNINLPATDPTSRQAVHVDYYANRHKFPTCIELFTYLHDVSPENGSPEIWPGSHNDWNFKDLANHGRGWIKASAFNRRAEKSPPFQPTIPKGSLGIRDARLWHSGMPNLSDQNNIMLGFLYFPHWYRNHMRITLPQSCRSIVEKWTQVDAIEATEFVDGEIDHLDSAVGELVSSLDFTQGSETGFKQIREKMNAAQGGEANGAVQVTERDYWTPGRKKLSERFTKVEDAKGKAKLKGKAKGKGRRNEKGREKEREKNDPLKPKSEGVKKKARKPRKKPTKLMGKSE